jgi:hypothetical protein
MRFASEGRLKSVPQGTYNFWSGISAGRFLVGAVYLPTFELQPKVGRPITKE